MKKLMVLTFLALITLAPTGATAVAGPSDGADLRAASWNCTPCPRF